MQTLHLRFLDLRAILLGEPPSRWPTPSLPRASTWEMASPFPSLGSARSAAKLSPGEFPRSCFTPLRPTLAVGAPPKTSHQRPDRCPTLGASLTMDSKFREARVVGPDGANTSQVCWPQTAKNNPHPAAPHMAGQAVDCSLQAPFSEVARSRAKPSPGRSPRYSLTPSTGLSFPLRPQRCQRAPRSGARTYGKKTADLTANAGAFAGVSKGARRRRLHLCQRGR
jgi:hypothetical protein